MEFRQVIYNQLEKLMSQNDKIVVLDADLAKPNGTFNLYQKFPDRCYNCGIAEGNMMGIAAGLSSYGFIPFVFTFAPFATRRACDQLAVSLAYSYQKAIIFGTDPGMSAETNGGTHMAFEDISVVRAIPRILVYDVVDANQLEQAIPQMLDYDGIVYVRVPRKTYPDVYDENYQFKLGQADLIKEGKDLSIFTSGIMTSVVLEALPLLKEAKIDAEIISLNTIKPLDEETILKSVRKTKKVVVVENHNIIGGAYSAVAELLAAKEPTKALAIGINDEFGQTGKYKELLEAYELDSLHIASKIIKFVSNK